MSIDDVDFYLVDLKSKFDKIKPNTYYLSYSGGKDCHFSKKIVQKTIDDKIIKVWDSMSDVKRELNIPVPHLVRVCKGQRKSTRGYKWCYYEEVTVECEY